MPEYDEARLFAWVCVDADYRAFPYSVFVHRDGLDIVVVYRRDADAAAEGLSTEDNRVARQQVEASCEDFVELKIPDHAQHHEWFKDFLKSRGLLSQYFGSIGGWFEEHGDKAGRDSWERFLALKRRDFVSRQLRDHGLPGLP